MKDTPALSVGRETVVALFSKGLMAASGFVGIVIFANELGPDGLGVFKTATAAALLLSQVPKGVGTAVRKRVSEVGSDAPAVFGTGLLLHVAYAAVVLVGFLAVRPRAVDFFGSAAMALGVVGLVAALGLFTVTNRMYSGTGHPALSSWVDAGRSLLTLGLQLLLLVAGYGPFGLVAGLALATTVAAAVSWAAARVRPALPGRRVVDSVGEYARWSVPTSVVRNLYTSADVLIVSALVGSGAVGFYATAVQMAMPATMFAGSIREALTVKASGLSSIDRAVREDLANAVSYAGLLAIPVFFGALAIPRPIMTTVFGGEFTAAAPALVGLTFFQILNVYRLPFEATVEGVDRPDVVLRINVLTLAVHLPLAVALGYAVGLLGVVGATVVAEAVRVATYQFVAHAEFGGVVLPRPVAEQVASGAVMAVAVSLLAGRVVTITSWFWLLAVVVAGAAVYFLTLGTISAHFRRTAITTLETTVAA